MPSDQVQRAITTTPDWSLVPSVQARLTITTTSNWTTIRLLEGTWHSFSVISISPKGEVQEVIQEMISFSQPLNRAEAGEIVELIVEVSFTELAPGEILILEIERGFLGSTQVEIQHLTEEGPHHITQFSWGESTTVEPTVDEGPKYPTGNYGFDMLEVVEEVFGSETYYTSPTP